MSPSAWVQDAVRFPLAFAQVREDPLLDQWIVEHVRPSARVVMVASGGCTAAALAAGGAVSELHIVDPNPAQMALARLKLALIAGTTPQDRLTLMGHAPLPSSERAGALKGHLRALGLTDEAVGSIDDVARLGPDHAGRYELLFGAFREALVDNGDELEAVLDLDDPREQVRRVAAETPLGHAIDVACQSAMSLAILVALFGEDATRNPREPFAHHFARRLRWVLEHQPASRNPFLWQMLLGRFPPGVSHTWLMMPSPATMPRVSWSVGTMDELLETRRGDCDYVHLSNILDWLSPDSARHTLELAWRALVPGGWILIRQLNSILDISALGPRFAWDVEAADRLFRADRSFFYRSLHVGRKS